MINLTIDNKPIQVPEGTTILKAARMNGIDIPTLCHFELDGMNFENKPGGCRVCVVEVKGRRNLAPACATDVMEGMEVLTHSARVINARKTVVELILSDHPNDCLQCEKNGDCELQSLTKRLGIKDIPFKGAQSTYRKDSTNYSRAVFRLYYQVVYPKKSDDERFDFRNLEGKRIAYMNSRPVGELLTSEGAVKFSVTNLDQAMCDLVKGKYDAVICYRYQARYLIDLHHFDNLLTDDISLPPREYCYVSHSKQLIHFIDRELLKMEMEGVTDEVYTIKSTFGGIRIPTWVWYLLGGIAILALIIINVIYSMSRKQLEKANIVLEKGNQELKQRNEELVIAREKALESDRMKSAFIQNMTHQIRTPLNIVTGFAQVINNDYETLSKDEIKMMVGQMMKNTDVITTIITKLIDLSIQESRHCIEKQDFVSCNNLCREAIRRVSFTHQDTVKVDVETTVPDSLLILTDKIVILKVLHELLSNADQFTPSGSITLGCYQPDEATVCFSVTDTGQGIPEEYRPKVFTKFFKPNEFSEGLGLGLTLCQTAVEQMGGNIRLDETYTTGARFIITLPLK